MARSCCGRPPAAIARYLDGRNFYDRQTFKIGVTILFLFIGGAAAYCGGRAAALPTGFTAGSGLVAAAGLSFRSLRSGRLSGIVMLAAVGLDYRMLSYFSFDSLCFERKAVSLILALSCDLLSVRLVSDGRRHCFDTALL